MRARPGDQLRRLPDRREGLKPTHSVGGVIEGLSDTEIEQRLRAAPDKRWQDLWDALDALTLEPEKGQWAGGEAVETIVVGGAGEAGVGAPGRIRTCDRRIRSPLLYPAELQGRCDPWCQMRRYRPVVVRDRAARRRGCP